MTDSKYGLSFGGENVLQFPVVMGPHFYGFTSIVTCTFHLKILFFSITVYIPYYFAL